MAESPASNCGVFELSILSDGKEIPDSAEVISVDVIRRVNSIPEARIVLADGDSARGAWPQSDAGTFVPGAEIEIRAGYASRSDVIFRGVVVRHGIEMCGADGPTLVVECRDAAVRMSVGRKNATFDDSKDSDTIRTLINNAALVAKVDATPVVHAKMVQYYCTDWDYMQARAEVNGMLVIVEDGTIRVSKPDTSGSPVLDVEYGKDLMAFQADLDACSQLAGVDGVAWDPATQSNVVIEPVQPVVLNRQGNLDSAKLAQVIGLAGTGLQTSAVVDKASLNRWAEGAQTKTGLARIRGRMSFQGSARALPGRLIDVSGVGERFSGCVFVSGVHQKIAAGEWVTEAEFGLAPDWYVASHRVEAPNASGYLPGIGGLHVGIVSKLDEDPAGEFRVQVTVPVLREDAGPVWARLSQVSASSGFGHFHVPEIGDEVILGFFNNDPSQPVVLGRLYSSANKPPHEVSADNNIKGFVSRSQMKLTFDDDAKSISIETPAGNRIVIDESATSVVVADQNGSSVTMDGSGMSLESPGDINIDAGGKIDISANQTISITSKYDVDVSAANIDLSAAIGFSAKGDASAELSASGQTTVKGAMVMIN